MKQTAAILADGNSNENRKPMNISVFCASSQPRNPRIAEAAAELGRRLALGEHTLLYGGSNLGLMGTLSGAALEHGGRVVGVIPTLFSEDIIRSQPVTELVRVRSMAERKEYLIAHSDAFVALPGGIGTLDEVSEVMVMNQLQIVNGKRALDGSYMTKPMILLNLEGFYNPFLEQLRVIKENGLMRCDGGLVAVASVEECLNILNTPSNQSNPI